MEKRKTNSIITFGLMLILVFSVISGNTVNAQNITTEEEKIEFLKSIGTSDEAISMFNTVQINNLYDDLYGTDARFSGFEYEIVEICESAPDERGNIPTSKLRLGIGTYDMFTNGKVTAIDVSLGFQWLEEPILNWTDAFTFTWDKNLFYDEGFYATSGCTLSGGKYFLTDSISAPATGQDGGLGWYLSIARPQMAISGCYGGAQVLLRPRTTIYSSTDLNSKMYFTYAHQIVGTSISFGLPASGGVSISGGNYDQQTYSYTYH